MCTCKLSNVTYHKPGRRQPLKNKRVAKEPMAETKTNKSVEFIKEIKSKYITNHGM